MSDYRHPEDTETTLHLMAGHLDSLSLADVVARAQMKFPNSTLDDLKISGHRCVRR